MREADPQHAGLFSYLLPEAHVQTSLRLRPIRQHVDTVVTALSPHLPRHSYTGRPSIAPET